MSPHDLEPFCPRGQPLCGGAFDGRVLPSVTVRTRRNGLRRYDPAKPAVVIDAYDAYNMMADYGLADVPFYYLSSPAVSTLVSFLFVGDMNKYRDYFLRTTFNAWPNRLWDNLSCRARRPICSRLAVAWGIREIPVAEPVGKVLYLYGLCAPWGSWKYRQDNPGSHRGDAAPSQRGIFPFLP